MLSSGSCSGLKVCLLRICVHFSPSVNYIIDLDACDYELYICLFHFCVVVVVVLFDACTVLYELYIFAFHYKLSILYFFRDPIV
jgi:hypothetical protein